MIVGTWDDADAADPLPPGVVWFPGAARPAPLTGGPASAPASRPAAVLHALRLTWILAAFMLARLALYIGLILTADSVNVGLAVLAIVASVGLLAAVSAAAIGLRAGRLWAARVLSGVLVTQAVLLVVSVVMGASATGGIPLALNAVAIGKLRRPESRAYLAGTTEDHNRDIRHPE